MYYTLFNAVDTDETGPIYPQIEFENSNEKEIDPVLQINKTRCGVKPPDDLIFDYFEVKNKAVNLTDILSSSFTTFRGFVISKKLLEIFIDSNIGDYKTYDITLKRNDKIISDYKYFHLISNMQELVSYQKSEFIYKEFDKESYLKGTINSYQELQDFFLKNVRLQSGKDLTPKKIVLKKEFPKDLDMFNVNIYGEYDIIVSEKLRDKIIEAKCTGVELYPLNDYLTIED